MRGGRLGSDASGLSLYISLRNIYRPHKLPPARIPLGPLELSPAALCSLPTKKANTRPAGRGTRQCPDPAENGGAHKVALTYCPQAWASKLRFRDIPAPPHGCTPGSHTKFLSGKRYLLQAFWGLISPHSAKRNVKSFRRPL